MVPVDWCGWRYFVQWIAVFFFVLYLDIPGFTVGIWGEKQLRFSLNNITLPVGNREDGGISKYR